MGALQHRHSPDTRPRHFLHFREHVQPPGVHPPVNVVVSHIAGRTIGLCVDELLGSADQAVAAAAASLVLAACTNDPFDPESVVYVWFDALIN